MKPRPIRMPNSLWYELAEEAEEQGKSTAAYVREILRNRQANTPDTLPDTDALAERVEALEAAVYADTDCEPQDSPVGDRGTPTPRGPETTMQNGGSGDMDEFRAELGEWLTENGPQTEHGRRGVLRCVDELEARGPLTSEDLGDMLEDEIGENYSRRKSMWESIKRWLEETPGVYETENYSEWAFAGVDEARVEF